MHSLKKEQFSRYNFAEFCKKKIILIMENIVVNTCVENSSTKSPWGKTPSVGPCSLASVMDEEVAKELQAQEDCLLGYHLQGNTSPSQMVWEGKGVFLVIRTLISHYDYNCDFRISNQ